MVDDQSALHCNGEVIKENNNAYVDILGTYHTWIINLNLFLVKKEVVLLKKNCLFQEILC